MVQQFCYRCSCIEMPLYSGDISVVSQLETPSGLNIFVIIILKKNHDLQTIDVKQKEKNHYDYVS